MYYLGMMYLLPELEEKFGDKFDPDLDYTEEALKLLKQASENKVPRASFSLG